MDRLDRANMMVLSALMLAAVTIGELRIRGREAETGARTESEAHRSDVLLVARAETYRQPDIMECPIFLLIRAFIVLGPESAVETVTERVERPSAGLRVTARPR